MGLTDSYRNLILKLFPRGLAFSREQGTWLYKLCDALAQEPARLEQRAMQLIEEADPSTTEELLPDWERVLALPDPAVSSGGSLTARRNDVVSKFTTKGGQQIAKYVERAEKLGFPVTITEFRPFRAGMSRCGGRLYSNTWRYAFQINAPAHTVTVFRCGSRCGERLGATGNERLEAAMRKKAASHTRVLFEYS